MGRRVFLHVGTMKSATSYLGQLCDVNREHLSDAGVYWADEGLRYDAVRDFFGRRPVVEGEQRPWTLLLRQIRKFPGDVLLSNEMLAALPVREIRRLVATLPTGEVKVVVTVRDLARVIPSHWQTTLKNGGTLGWTDFCSAVCGDAPDDPEARRTWSWFWRRHDVPAVIERWTRVVPAGDVSVVTVPAAGSDRELVARRFGGVIGVDLTGLTQPDWSNPSLGAHSAELLRRINLRFDGFSSIERVYGFRIALAAALGAGDASTEPRYGLTPAQQEWVRRRATEMVERVAASGVQVVGDLDDLLPRTPSTECAADCVDPSDSSDAELVEAAMLGLAGMVRECAAVKSDNRRLAGELAALAGKHDRLEKRVAQQAARRRAEPAPPPPSTSALTSVGRRAVALLRRRVNR